MRQGASLWQLKAAQVFLHVLSLMGGWAYVDCECVGTLIYLFGSEYMKYMCNSICVGSPLLSDFQYLTRHIYIYIIQFYK